VGDEQLPQTRHDLKSMLATATAENAKMSEAETVAGDVASYANTLEPDRKNTSLSSRER
jgi:hypothetical protein